MTIVEPERTPVDLDDARPPFDWKCDGCGALYEAPRSACELCGCTEFASVEELRW